MVNAEYRSENHALIPSQFKFFIIDHGAKEPSGDYLDSIFALRYEVYCKERSFLAPDDYPEKQEEDIYDPYSIHLAGVHQSGQTVATSRLILPSEKGFPLLEHCKLFPEYEYLVDPERLIREPTAEISRLAISKSFRRRKDDGDYGASVAQDPQVSDNPLHEVGLSRRQQPEIIIGIFRLIYQASKRNGITHWLAAMEKSLFRLLQRFRLDFNPIGPELDYYGPVAPYFADINDIDTGLFKNNPSLLDALTHGLEPELMPMVLRGGK
jgi:N-acyl amino acid synthase of PEP-CTERM/exosortase system